MPEIDLDPKDYRAAPLKGEPVFARGGLLRLAVVAGFFLLMVAITLAISVPYSAVFNIVWPASP